MNAALQLYMDGLGYLVSGSKGQLLHEAGLQLKMAGLGYLVSVSKGQLLHECSISVVHCWSGSFCNGK